MNLLVQSYHSNLFSEFPELSHGFGTRYFNTYDELQFLKQKHSTKVSIVFGYSKNKVGDALLTKQTKIGIGIKTADCLPILLYERNNRIIEIVHAGWKGTVDGIVLEAIRAMKKLGGVEKNVYASFGPAIEYECYDIPDERAELIIKKLGDNKKFIKKIMGKYYFNLITTNVEQLISMGIPEKNIEVNTWCTFCNELFYSRKRDYCRESGHNISYIQLN